MSQDKEDDYAAANITQRRKSRSALGKIVIVTLVASALSIAGIGGSIVQVNAAAEPAVKITPPRNVCPTTLTISTPADGQNFFENERGPGNDGFMTIKFSGSIYNPCRVVFAKLDWYLDGQFLGTGGVVYKTLFAGCESYTTHTARLVATFQQPPAKAESVAASTASNSISKTVSFTTGIVC